MTISHLNEDHETENLLLPVTLLDRNQSQRLTFVQDPLGPCALF